MRVAFVAPFFGAKASGGAEAECRQTVRRLAQGGVEVEVFTTTALDLVHGWQVPWHLEGRSVEEGLVVHRFPAEPASPGRFATLNTRLLRGETLAPDEERQFVAMHVSSEGLLRGLAREGGRFDWLCFIPYLFGTTLYGARLWPRKSILIPCLHEEGYAALVPVRSLFGSVARIVFHAAAEQALARRLYGDLGGRDVLIGEGIETEVSSDADRFRRKYGVEGPFLLYAGRKDATKNVDELIRHFAQYLQGRRDGLTLVLIGPGSIPVPAECALAVRDLGFVPEQDKRDAYAAAALFCQPSLNESFSIVMMEAWLCGTPCLVHRDCAVTTQHVNDSGGGLAYRSAAEFAHAVDRLRDRETALRMAAAGRRYVLERFAWDRIIRRYRDEVFCR